MVKSEEIPFLILTIGVPLVGGLIIARKRHPKAVDNIILAISLSAASLTFLDRLKE